MIIETRGLTRDYVTYSGSGLRRTRGIKHALAPLDLTVAPGEAVGYIGANGSGKSTTIKMLAGILTPTAGTVRTCGLDPVPNRRVLARRIGVVAGQRSGLWPDLPLIESFPILAAMHRIPKGVWRPHFETLADELALREFMGRQVRTLSLGERMRGEVAAALLHRPDLLILDEPTVGMDVLSKDALRRFLARERAERGTTLFLTTHDMGDVQRLCDRIVVIDHGRLAFDGSQADLATATDAERHLVVDVAGGVGADLTLPEGARLVSREHDRLEIAFGSGTLTAHQVFAAVQAQVEVVDLALSEPAIEDLVRRIYQRGHPG